MFVGNGYQLFKNSSTILRNSSGWSWCSQCPALGTCLMVAWGNSCMISGTLAVLRWNKQTHSMVPYTTNSFTLKFLMWSMSLSRVCSHRFRFKYLDHNHGTKLGPSVLLMWVKYTFFAEAARMRKVVLSYQGTPNCANEDSTCYIPYRILAVTL